MNLLDKINCIKGIGDKTALLFSKVSVFCVKDLLMYYPNDYIQYPCFSSISELQSGKLGAFTGRVSSSCKIFQSKGKTVLSFDVADESGAICVYYFNMPFLKNKYKKGMYVTFYGKISLNNNGKLTIANPKETNFEEYNKLTKGLFPVYSLVKGLTNNIVSKAIYNCISTTELILDYLDDDILNKYDLIKISDAVRLIHFPENYDDVIKARKRLAFDEFITFIAQMKELNNRENDNININAPIFTRSIEVNELINSLPYKLTNDQLNAINEIADDTSSGRQMNRLLQGDVGCGKTIVALMSSYNAVLNGYQAVIMAPTIVLATQHYNDVLEMNHNYKTKFKPVLLTGSMKASEKKEALKGIKEGEYNLIIGTHALFSEKCEYNKLGLVICDEQHRFGVKQRLSLLEKGETVHLLVMSATPIPRTLGIILYGDLSVSLIKEKPSMRKPLKNAVVGPEYRPKNYQFIQNHINAGEQAYIICPMVEFDEASDLKNVETYSDEIKPYLDKDVRIDILHGKMKGNMKDEVMNRFKNHETDLLISTTVIEVGVNVPNATVIMIENAERFGLATLHQLRGRVGRSDKQSYAIFVTENKTKKNLERLQILSKTNDGFEIANKDLELRGPGDFFGFRQSGLPGFKIADIYNDADTLKTAKNIYDKLSKKDDFDNSLFIKELTFVDNNFICL